MTFLYFSIERPCVNFPQWLLLHAVYTEITTKITTAYLENVKGCVFISVVSSYCVMWSGQFHTAAALLPTKVPLAPAGRKEFGLQNLSVPWRGETSQHITHVKTRFSCREFHWPVSMMNFHEFTEDILMYWYVKINNEKFLLVKSVVKMSV
jgi:hypothetical protein